MPASAARVTQPPRLPDGHRDLRGRARRAKLDNAMLGRDNAMGFATIRQPNIR
jgi:hypothetical protein